jgi:hypothetical protein
MKVDDGKFRQRLRTDPLTFGQQLSITLDAPLLTIALP